MFYHCFPTSFGGFLLLNHPSLWPPRHVDGILRSLLAPESCNRTLWCAEWGGEFLWQQINTSNGSCCVFLLNVVDGIMNKLIFTCLQASIFSTRFFFGSTFPSRSNLDDHPGYSVLPQAGCFGWWCCMLCTVLLMEIPELHSITVWFQWEANWF